jgi:NTP pyrophosphatase (non-canonical NTP hydrolase)
MSEKDLFAIEVLDHNKPEDRQKILDIIFNGEMEKNDDPKINKKRMLVLLYKFLLEESYEHVAEIKRKQMRGKYMNRYEEDVLVNVHLIENYLEGVIEQRANFSKKLAMSLIDKEKFNKFTSQNHSKILEQLNDAMHNDPFILDAGIHGEHHITIDL